MTTFEGTPADLLHWPASSAMAIVTICRVWSPSGPLLSTARQLRERFVVLVGRSWCWSPRLIGYPQLLLRIEKYPHRMNFNKGVLESRRLHYKHLYKLLVRGFCCPRCSVVVGLLMNAATNPVEYAYGDRAHTTAADPGDSVRCKPLRRRCDVSY